MRILITDTFSSSNRGDAAILDGILTGLRSRLPDAEFTAVSHFPEVARTFHPGIDVIGDDEPIILARTLARTDLVVSCGGSFLNDLYALNLNPRLALYHAAKRAGIPYVFFAQSIGPLESPISRLGTREVLDGAAWVLARDAASARTVRALGAGCPVDVGVDAAVLGESCLVEKRADNPLVLGVTVRGWHFPDLENPTGAQQAYEDAVVDACGRWLEQTGGVVRFLSNCTDLGGYRQDDRVVARRIAARLGKGVEVVEEGDLSSQQVRSQAAACDFFLGTRMHSLVFATTAGVPAVGIAYEFKTPEWLTMVGLGGLSVPISDCSGLTDLLMDSWNRRKALTVSVAEALPTLQAQWSSQFDTLAEIAAGKQLPRSRSAKRSDSGWQGETWRYDIAHRRMRAVVDVVLAEGGERVLDIGCSTGLLGRMLGPVFDYTGVDIAESVATNEERFRIHVADLNLARLPVEGPFDTITCSGSLEYLDGMGDRLQSIRELLTPGGLAVLTLYNLQHFASAVLGSSRHSTWRFQEGPDDFALGLAEVGLRPMRIFASSGGYTPSRAVNDEEPTDWDREGGGQVAPERLPRLAHQVVVVCRALEPIAGPSAIDSLAGQGDLLGATRIAVDLVKHFPWAARAWSDLGVLFHLHGDNDKAVEYLTRALHLNPLQDAARQSLAALGVDPVEWLRQTDDFEARVMIDGQDHQAWDGLLEQRLGRGKLASAGVLAAMRDRILKR